MASNTPPILSGAIPLSRGPAIKTWCIVLESTCPYCRRYTHSGYSTYPGAVSLSMTCFGSSGSVSVETVTITATTTGSASGTPPPTCPKQISTGKIVGSVIGGLVIIATAATALSNMLRHLPGACDD
ncbi:hypothetical protein K440DRAFT_625195 [Wilcoxina mikolae CBS 423.85]|nr:hypothetical protein K440DRAFT_625195 [Wilcoxina mikolae CBS 423.85]